MIHWLIDERLIYIDSFSLTGTLKSPTGVFKLSTESGVFGVSGTGLGVDTSEKIQQQKVRKEKLKTRDQDQWC